MLGIENRTSAHARAQHCWTNPISFPESSLPFTSGRKTRALGATISGMRHRCRLRNETGWAESPEFGHFKMVAPRALVFRPLVKGKWKTLGARLGRTCPNEDKIMKHPQLLREKFDQFQILANISQHVATCRNRVAKRTQHVTPNSVAICCVEMLQSFGWGLIYCR